MVIVICSRFRALAGPTVMLYDERVAGKGGNAQRQRGSQPWYRVHRYFPREQISTAGENDDRPFQSWGWLGGSIRYVPEGHPFEENVSFPKGL